MLIQETLAPNQIPARFKEIFHAYYPLVCRQTVYLLGTTEAVEDIAQETFLKLYYSPPAELHNIGGWLARVAANLSYNYLKSEKSRKTREANTSLYEPGKVVPLEDLVMRNQEVKRVRDILNEMQERDRMVLLLKFSGYNYREIAETVDVEKSSVGTILARAQKRFKTLYLEKEGGESHVLR